MARKRVNQQVEQNDARSVDEKEKKESRPTPIMYGIATCTIDGVVESGEGVEIYESVGECWKTNKGLVSKLYLLLRNL